MAIDDEILVNPELSAEFRNFEEFCTDMSGRELTYLDVVARNPLEMDCVTLAFSLRHLVRLSGKLLELLLSSLDGDSRLELGAILASKGVDLDKSQATRVRDVIFAFRDSADPYMQDTLVKAFQLLAITRERRRVMLDLGESYAPPDEGWSREDFGGDDLMLETVRSIEDPHWKETEGN